jgi:hypothetical protein
VTLSRFFWIVTTFTLGGVIKMLLTPSGTVPSKENQDFAVFFTFMLQKRPKCFLFQNSLQKYLKSQKERFRAIFDQINSIPGLNDPLKVVHFSPHHTSNRKEIIETKYNLTRHWMKSPK